MDAITLLKDDHKTVERLFKQFEKAGEKAYAEKRKLSERICTELSVHAAIEEQLFYPVIRGTVDGVEDMTLEALEEHHIVKWVLSELDDLDPKDERFTAKMTVLMENVRHHVEEEEDDLFPKVRESIGRKDLADLGEAMQAAKAIAPTHPHPRQPDTPPGNIVGGAVLGVADRVGDTVKSAAGGAVSTAQNAAEGAVSGAQDLIGRIIGGRSAGSANGNGRSSSSRSSRSHEAARAAKRTARSASSTAKKAAGNARKATDRTTDKTTGSAKRAANSTKRTARKAAGTTRTTARTAGRATKAAAKRTTSAAKRSAAQR